MAKKNFSAGSTKSGVLNNDGGEKLRENTRKKHAEYTLRKTKICKRRKKKNI